MSDYGNNVTLLGTAEATWGFCYTIIIKHSYPVYDSSFFHTQIQPL
uniref:Uncharacterized protein n=1 Tax=Anguilla anguilla TaxID=7936 RepID=A0A0E9R1U3_ANGAN